MKKKKISAFEFAIMSVADIEEAKRCVSQTEKERHEERINNLKEQASKLRIVSK